ncbi:hypothetical protein KVR01_011445 [Diaporthe batatas]|uniref:uncharacterized protein n=1 Tax=Diaporthe batatas TaxID=748121 RepID=UPI001D046A7E|nr:uncharacterized protein KVR01_011445 [Diaporthe batatas]KAG8159002.1 hypothetical protein KVR01_011445 [Diaporthe batatas]
MEAIVAILTWSWWRVGVTVVLYFVSLGFYRLFLHPLSRFPGPKLAAVTRWYEAYYDIVKDGQYTFKIEQMHRQYGPILRISPHELHVSDPAFFETLYSYEGRWHKYDWAVNAWAAKYATIFTADHELHKARRHPLSPFFSTSKVAAQQSLIRKHVQKLQNRLAGFTISGETVNLGAATTALTRDVANDFVLGKSYNSLDRDDFDFAQLIASHGAGSMWRLSKHLRWVAPTMRSVPINWMIRFGDEGMKAFFGQLKENIKDTETLMTAAQHGSSAPSINTQKRTVVHEILESRLPPHEKAFVRVFEEVSTVTGAGFETTASALRLIFINLFSNAEILQRLRAELSIINPQSGGGPSLQELKRLPYLTSVLMEGLRLSPALGTRMARVSPDRTLRYGGWQIPAGTPVGMTVILMHTDGTVFPDPWSFKPDRWMDPELRIKAERSFAPFSRGTRICLGMNLAWAVMYMVVAGLAQRFDFQFEDATAEDFLCVSDQFSLGTRAKGSLKAFVSDHNA